MLILLTVSCLVATAVDGILLRTPLSIELEEPLLITPRGPQVIELEGQTHGNYWHVNLADGVGTTCDTLRQGNIEIHVVTRDDHLTRNTYVLNDTKSCIKTCAVGWGAEERIGGLPITPGVHFNMAIICETNYFQIYIDGKHYTSYAYRIPVDKITHLVLCGAFSFRRIEIVNPQELGSNIRPGFSATDHCTTINHIKIN